MIIGYRNLRMVGGLLIVLTIGVVCAQDFHVSLLGDGILHPGDDKIITVLIENEGRVENFILNENTSNLLALVTTAKDLRVELEDDGAPIKVESLNPSLVGDLPSGMVAKVNFRVRVDEDAKLGVYEIPVKLKYTKVTYSTTSSGVILSYREDETRTEYLSIEVARRDYDFSVVSLKSSLHVGGEGYVEVVIKNTGRFKIYNAILIINTTPSLKPNPMAMESYLGDLDVNCEARAKFKVYVMEGAISQSYPAKLILQFKRSDERTAFLSKTIGLDVEEDMLSVEVVDSLLTSSVSGEPSRGFVSVRMENLGECLNDSIAILSFDTPLLQSENVPYVGRFCRGVKFVTFYVKSLAPEGSYRGYVILKYRKFGDEVVSSKHYLEVNVRRTPLEVEGAGDLAVGMKGEIEVSIRNKLNRDVKNVELTIVTPKSMRPLSSSYFIESLKPFEVGIAKFRVEVLRDATSGSYRFYIIEKFDLGDLEDLLCVVEASVYIKSGVACFDVVSVEGELYPDETGEVKVVVRNMGNLTIHNCVVELLVSTPLTIAGGSTLSGIVGSPQPGLHFIGELNPNEVATARFKIDIDKDAGAGFYPATVKIRYDDDEGYTHESNPMTVFIEVREKPLLNPVTVTAITLIVMALIAGLKFARRRR